LTLKKIKEKAGIGVSDQFVDGVVGYVVWWGLTAVTGGLFASVGWAIPLVIAQFKHTGIGGLITGHILVQAEYPFKKVTAADVIYSWVVSFLAAACTLGAGILLHLFYPCCGCGDGYQFGFDFLSGQLTVDEAKFDKLCRKYDLAGEISSSEEDDDDERDSE